MLSAVSSQRTVNAERWLLEGLKSKKSATLSHQLIKNSIQDTSNMEQHIIDINAYQKWLEHLCNEIDKQRLKAVMQLNAATLQHYWWLGNDIMQKQKEQGWGAKVIDQLSMDLQKHYGSDSGYSIPL